MVKPHSPEKDPAADRANAREGYGAGNYIAGGESMGFKDLPGGQNAKAKNSRAELAGEISPQKKESPKDK